MSLSLYEIFKQTVKLRQGRICILSPCEQKDEYGPTIGQTICFLYRTKGSPWFCQYLREAFFATSPSFFMLLKVREQFTVSNTPLSESVTIHLFSTNRYCGSHRVFYMSTHRRPPRCTFLAKPLICPCGIKSSWLLDSKTNPYWYQNYSKACFIDEMALQELQAKDWIPQLLKIESRHEVKSRRKWSSPQLRYWKRKKFD